LACEVVAMLDRWRNEAERIGHNVVIDVIVVYKNRINSFKLSAYLSDLDYLHVEVDIIIIVI
jgi:hypothetical protein